MEGQGRSVPGREWDEGLHPEGERSGPAGAEGELSRKQARDLILYAVNHFKRIQSDVRMSPYPPVIYGPKQVQKAVRIARHNRLVEPEVLEAAGFNA